MKGEPSQAAPLTWVNSTGQPPAFRIGRQPFQCVEVFRSLEPEILKWLQEAMEDKKVSLDVHVPVYPVKDTGPRLVLPLPYFGGTRVAFSVRRARSSGSRRSTVRFKEIAFASVAACPQLAQSLFWGMVAFPHIPILGIVLVFFGQWCVFFNGWTSKN